jgi:hypothetical protein
MTNRNMRARLKNHVWVDTVVVFILAERIDGHQGRPRYVIHLVGVIHRGSQEGRDELLDRVEG